MITIGAQPRAENFTLTYLGPVEDYPVGYPRFSAFLASHPSFHLYRRFFNPRIRLLLLKQDRLSVLKKQLEKLDREDRYLLSVGSIRIDCNKEKTAILADIREAIKDHSSFHSLAFSS